MKNNLERENRPPEGIRFKVLLGFGFSLLVVVVAGFFTWKSITSLTDSVNILSKPNTEVNELHEIVSNLTQAESSVRAYTLTNDKKYLDEYDKMLDSINKKLNVLKISVTGEPNVHQQVDTIVKLVNDKKEIFGLFIQMKSDNKNNETEISDKILNKLNESVAGFPDEKKDSILGKPQKTGLFGGIRKLFGGSPKKTEDNTTAATDNQGRKQNQKAKLSDVKQIVASAQQEENTLTQLNGAKEMQLLQRDKLVMDRIRDVVGTLETSALAISIKEANKAKAESWQAIKVVSLVALTGGIFTILFLLLIFGDIRRSVQYRKELIVARQTAEKLAHVKEEFLANMSHEIRTPLNSIIGFAEQLSQTALDTKQAGYLKLVEKSSDHLLALVNEILDYSKIEAGKLSIEKVPFNFAEITKEVYELLRIRAAEKDVMLSYSVDDSLEVMALLGDPHRLMQILINLVGNGIKFTEKGMVDIHCSLVDETNTEVKVKLQVSDTGIGIAQQKLESIFDEFSQAESDTSRRFGGTGLGLAICKRLAEMQNGTIEVSSTLNKGSVFSVTLPFSKLTAGAPVAIIKKEENQIDRLKHKYILVVDDEDMNLQLARVILEKWGVMVDSAKSGKSAIRLLHERPYDVVLIDIQMPEMSGTEVVSQIRKGDSLNRKTPFVALTANVIKEEQQRFLKAGVNDVLLKPFREKELYGKLIEMLYPQRKEEGTNNEVHAEPINYNGNGHALPLYSLEFLERSSGANKEFVLSMAESFVTNNTRNILLLADFNRQKDWAAAGGLAHKMIPSYRYLGVKSGEENLKKIEQLALHEKKFDELPVLIQMVITSTEKVMSALTNEIKTLKDEFQTQ